MFGDKSGLIQSFGVAAMSGICTYVPVYNSVYLFSVRLTILATCTLYALCFSNGE